MERILTETEAADYLETSPQVLYRERKNGRLESSRSGRRIIYTETMLEEYVARNTVKLAKAVAKSKTKTAKAEKDPEHRAAGNNLRTRHKMK